MALRLNVYRDGAEFLGATESYLLEREAENGLTLGVAGLDMRPENDNFWCSVSDGGRILGTAFHTPPYKVVLTSADDGVIEFLAREIHGAGRSPSGVLGPAEVSNKFAEIWNGLSDGESSLGASQRIYRLDRVMTPAPTPGEMRPAVEGDVDLLAGWYEAFAEETGTLRPRPGTDIARAGIREGQLFTWDDGGVVSMAAWSRPTRNGVTISAVYTPGEQRARGYASSLVAALCQQLLDGGKRFCVLYTDLANHTANDIYMSIGFQPVCDVADYIFE